MTPALAKRTAEQRDQVGGVSSVEDLSLLLDLPTAVVDQLRGMAVFVPG